MRATAPLFARWFETSARGDRWVPYHCALGEAELYIRTRIYAHPRLRTDRERCVEIESATTPRADFALGVDVGTGSARAGLVDLKTGALVAELRACALRPHQVLYLV